MKLPLGEAAVVAIEKLEGYCLNASHQRGRHKARVFAASGVGLADAEDLRQALLAAARDADAEFLGADEFGERWRIDSDWLFGVLRVPIRSYWIVEAGGGAPRLTTCYVR